MSGALGPLEAHPLPETIICKRAEGYAFYALYPEAFLQAAIARGRGSTPLRVIGIRSIGLGLGCLVAAATGAPRPISVRPTGHPFVRALSVDNAMLQRLDDDGSAHFAIADEGPGLSGSSFAAVLDWTEASGIAGERVELFPSHRGEPGPNASARNRERWRSLERHVVEMDALILSPVRQKHRLTSWMAGIVGSPVERISDISGGRWRSHHFGDEATWPACDLRQERRKFLVTAGGRDWLAKFAGLGRYGAGKHLRARSLSEAGFIPEVAGFCHGFLLEQWTGNASPLDVKTVDREILLRRVADYLAFRCTHFPAGPTEGADTHKLAEMLLHNSVAALGEDVAEALHPLLAQAESLQQRVHPVKTDNRMHEWEWLVTEEGRLLKTDALDHCESHDLIGCQDIAWDIAGAAVELDLSPEERKELCGRIRTLTGRAVDDDLLTFLHSCYCAFQLGSSAMAAASHEDMPAEAARLQARASRYEQVVGESIGLPFAACGTAY